MNQHSIIVAIRGGVAEVDHDPDNTVMIIDWDEVGNDFGYAEETIDRIADAHLPTDTKRHITGVIIEVWPDIIEKAAPMGLLGNLPTATCKHCGRTITLMDGWVDTEATGDDAAWRESCDRHDTFTAEHEPIPDYIWPEPNGDGWIDAWNGWYDTLEHALEEAAGGGSQPWVLNRGEGLVDEDERERRDSVRRTLAEPPTLDQVIDEATEMGLLDDDPAVRAAATLSPEALVDAANEARKLNEPNWLYPLYAKCKVCGEKLQFDIDPGGTPGQNGDWGANGDYGCITGDDEGSDGHTPIKIKWKP